MQNSQLNTLTMPFIPIGDSGQTAAVAVAQADATPMRVIVRNISLGVIIALSFDSATLVNNSNGGGGVFQLPAGTSEVIVLAPRQKLFGVAQALGAQLCIAISEALPLDLKP